MRLAQYAPLLNVSSIIEMVRSILEANLDFLSKLLVLFTGTVVIGLWLEYVPEFLEKASIAGARKGFRNDRREQLEAQIWYPRWMKRFEVLGAIFVVTGVSGELYTEFSRFGIEARLRDLNGSLSNAMRAQSAEANERASKADRDAALARRDAGHAEERAGKLEVEAAKLRAAIADRDLSTEQQLEIKRSLMKFYGSTVWIRSYPNDGEALRLILEIKAALAPEIHVEDRTGQLSGDGPYSAPILGIAIEPAHDRGLAEALVSTLRTHGKLTVADMSPFGSFREQTEILVGLKPVALAQVTANLARVTQRSSATPRRLSISQMEDIKGKLRNLIPGAKLTANLLHYPDDPESESIAGQIESALVAAQWDVSSGVGIEPSRSVIGIAVNWIAEPPQDNLDNALKDDCQVTAALIANGLSTNGCGFGRQSDELIISGRMNPNALIKIVVGKNQ